MPTRLTTWLLLLATALLPTISSAADWIRIGVLSHRGDAATLQTWSPTADYLNATLTDYFFEIVPLNFDQVEPAVDSGEVDFVLVNPGIYVNLEVRHRVTRIATLNNRRNGVPYNLFGGVIFTRSERDDIEWLSDLVGKRFMAVDRTSLGGYQMAWRELRGQAIEPQIDFEDLSFAGTHDKVVMAVRNGEADAGTVRTDILERMARQGTINLNEFRVLNPKQDADFPFIHSTRLYPEWPFSKVRHISNQLAQQVAVALLKMPADHPAADKGDYSGWTIPLDYQPVHDLFKELKLAPYDETSRFTLLDVLRYYWKWVVVGTIVALALLFMSSWVWQLNRELKKAQRFLEHKHDLILNSVGDGIYGVNLEGNSTFVNRAMERITGWSAEDLIGHNQHELLHHTRADGSAFPGIECPVYHTFRDDMPRFVAEDIFWCKDGQSLPVEYSSTPIKDTHGATVGAVVVFRDITERKEAAEELRQHQAEFAHIARVSTMGEMASGIAHEINQPLAAIANYTRASIRMLESGKGDIEQITEIMTRAANQADRAGEIIRQLRNFIRKETPERSRVDINNLVREVAVLIGPEANKSRVTIDLNLQSELPPVHAHAIQVEQVALNLARNAIEAMAESDASTRQLTITTAPGDDKTLSVKVSDTGPGITAEAQEQLFDQFFTTKPRGMGLGLSISRGIIEAHEGRLWVETNVAAGTTFSFILPTAESEETL
ncbi:histidine kinase [Solemya pervernicosa gill symbiont]|uniref:histidine kinase n=1 Tax=Solemya pervernicosa gill symbiont TaxID=642797 RepID=A0A1T2LAY7_9GAMM|nr:PhnD/SsuA/transferrin family substrate-binding protein [Candidatus Reidiella endopervernicosa]OOZ42269.1 histidine kinase [Solemya pervernicosa gill symbiont]